MKVGQRMASAHRVSYELYVGPIPSGLDLDHLCRVRSCVNPRHLEPVDRRTNVIRGLAPTVSVKIAAEKKLARTHCKYGHEYTAQNTGIAVSNGARYCKRCNSHTGRRARKAVIEAKKSHS